MATNNKTNVLSEEFLMDLFRTAMEDKRVLGAICQHVENKYLPDRDSQTLLKVLRQYYNKNNKVPPFSVIREMISGNRGAVSLLEDIFDTSEPLETAECLSMLEEYIKRTKFQEVYKELGQVYNKDGYDATVRKLEDYADWRSQFSLTDDGYTDILATFSDRFKENRAKNNAADTNRQVVRFYIDELDARNEGRNLRTQLTYILAATGVGKSHAIRWVGRNACMDGLNVLHFQLEGGKEEVENAYSASLVFCNSYRYEHGTLRDADVERMVKELESVSGSLYVKSFPKFNSYVSTIDIKEGIAEFKKKHEVTPDVVLIDSADLLTDSSGRTYDEKSERHKRVRVANDLKDLAADENVWIVATYQSTVEDPQWLNDEKNVFTEYNTAEAKGLSRPLTHLITLNQSSSEYKEQTMRINVAKSRFFKKGDVFKIATDYNNEVFYDRTRTMNINKTI